MTAAGVTTIAASSNTIRTDHESVLIHTNTITASTTTAVLPRWARVRRLRRCPGDHGSTERTV